MITEIENLINSTNDENLSDVTLDLLGDIAYLTEELDSKYLFCDLRGDVDVVEGLTDALNILNINKVYLPLDQMDYDYYLSEFQYNGWQYLENQLVNDEYEVALLQK